LFVFVRPRMAPAMRSQTEYYRPLVSAPDQGTAAKVFDLVWRFDFTAPGFCLLDAGPSVDSHMLRGWMMNLKKRLSEIGVRRGGRPFVFRSMGRFDQQENTKFHLDGAPDPSMLMLGYEPSKVRSRLFLADYSRAAFDLRITPQQFLSDFNPMYRKNEELLAHYVTELPQATESHGYILLINNSSLPFTEGRTNPLGVMHKAEILNPTQAGQRLVNSMMLVTEGEEIGKDQQEAFMRTKEISKKIEYRNGKDSTTG
jgi:hypothetical protein